MFVQPIDYILAGWFVLAALSTAYVAWDQFRNNPEPAVMKWGFILVTLYLGPVGLLLYVLADKEPRPGTHEEFIQPLWKQGIGSTIHCVAGDATGIIIAAVITAVIGFPMWVDIIIEYIAGFALGSVHLPGPVHEEHDGRHILGECPQLLHAGVHQHECHDGRHGPGDGYPDDGPRHARHVARRTLVLGRHGPRHRCWFPDGLSVQRLARFQGSQTWPDDRAARAEAEARSSPCPPRACEEWVRTEGMQTRPRSEHHGSSHEKHQQGRGGGHGSHGGELPPAFAPTRTQVTAVATFTTLMLVGGFAYPFTKVNMYLTAHEVGDVIMAPGMIMDFDTPADSMRDMAAIDPRLTAFKADAASQGGKALEPRLENGVKVFDLEASVIRWSILPGETVEAYAYNNQVPGPTLRVTEGDRVRINVTNKLPESTTVHWHGLILPNEMDGPAEITQEPIQPGKTFSYEYTVGQHGTYFYHTHDHVDRQQSLGLYGALIIDPKNPSDEIAADLEYTVQLQEWLKREWLTYPSMPMEGGQPNFFTINGKAFPATDTVKMKVGQLLKVRFIGSHTTAIHPMHIHGGPFQVAAVDGETLQESARYMADTVNVAPGQRYDVLWQAQRPGKWLVHCHIPHHTTNNNVETKGGGGLMLVVEVE